MRKLVVLPILLICSQTALAEDLPYTIIENGILVGDDISKIRARNPQDCFAKCSKLTNCMALSYVVKSKQCWLKSGLGTPASQEGVISGIKMPQ
jgi:hypothetical protein